MSPDQQFVLEIAKIFGWVFSVACATATIIGGIAFWRTDRGAAASFTKIVQRSGLLEMITVILIAAATSNLRVLDKISAESTVAIFSGIVGYVLGGVVKGKLRSDQED